MKLSLGPVPYYWDREAILAFYRRVAQAPVDIVYIGETVCSKRRALRLPEWLELADRLHEAGKEVVLSTLALIEAESEVSYLRTIIENGRYAVEANDMAAVGMLENAASFVIGPHVNVYNRRALEVLARAGAMRWVMPFELDRQTLTAMQAARPAGMETEIVVFGRMPLAFSARCFTARAHNLPKDNCGFRCADYPDGLSLRTREGESFLNLNGIQVQSGRSVNLLGDLTGLRELGVDVLRLQPQSQGLFEIIAAFRGVLDGKLADTEAGGMLAGLSPEGLCSGYWRGVAGMTPASTGAETRD